MSRLDLAKEQIACLKLWLGILVAAGISLRGWLLSNFSLAYWLLVLADIGALTFIAIGGYAIHRRIEAKILDLEEL